MQYLLIFLLSFSTYALEFKLGSKKIKTISLKEFESGILKNNNVSLKKKEEKIFNPERSYERVYVGYELYKLLDLVYGIDWMKFRKILFIANDGYRQSIHIEKMLNISKGKMGLIAYKEKGKKGFSKFDKGKYKIDPAPLYLVWSGFNKDNKKKLMKILKWPYKLKTIVILK